MYKFFERKNMNKNKSLIFSLVLTFLPNIIAMDALDTITLASGQSIIIKPITDNFSCHEELFHDVYTALYAKHPHTMDDAIKQFSTIDALIAFSYAYEQKEFEAQKPNSCFVHAILDGKPIGYVSFDVQPDGSIYARNLMVASAYQGMGFAKRLVQTIFMLRPHATKINLITGRANVTAVNMYKSHGCVEIPIPPTQAWADPASWIALEYTRK